MAPELVSDPNTHGLQRSRPFIDCVMLLASPLQVQRVHAVIAGPVVPALD